MKNLSRKNYWGIPKRDGGMAPHGVILWSPYQGDSGSQAHPNSQLSEGIPGETEW